MDLQKIKEISESIKDNVGKVIIGKDEKVDLILASLYAKGHILLEDIPGTGKTVLAKAIAKSIDAKFKRIQFTPDLLPSDITGSSIFNQVENKFNFIKGPVFTNILLADEINRATPRTQSSLLEVMEEGQVTTDGTTRILDNPFIVIATENPIENAGPFPLPEAQNDRFLMKISMGYPSKEEEIKIMNRFIKDDPLSDIGSVCTKDDIASIQEAIKDIYVHKDIIKYIADIISKTREDSNIELGVSPRGTLALLKAAQSLAAIKGREYVIPDDIKFLSAPVLSHRIIARNTLNSLEENYLIINSLVESIDVPTENWREEK